MQLIERPRRNRKNAWIRAMASENFVGPQHFIDPLFIHEGDGLQPIQSMPGCSRLGLNALIDEAGAALEDGIGAVVLFPALGDDKKTPLGEESYNSEGLVQRALRALKGQYPELTCITDVALDPFSSDGHDGIVSEDGVILNDETVEILVKQAVSQAEAGADIISPSDMMDGRVGAIRAGWMTQAIAMCPSWRIQPSTRRRSTGRSETHSILRHVLETRKPIKWTQPMCERLLGRLSSTSPKAQTWSWSSPRAHS